MFGLTNKAGFGLQILDHELRIVQLRVRSGRVDVRRFHAEPIAPGIVRGGSVLNEEAVSRQLAAAAARLGIEGAKVHLSLPTASAVLRRAAYPAKRDKELRGMIDVELNGGGQMPFKDPAFDFIRLGPALDAAEAAGPESNDRDRGKGGAKIRTGKREEVLVFASPSAVVDSYVRVVRQAGLSPRSVEPAPLAMLRLLIAFAQAGPLRLAERLLIVHAGVSQLEFSIFVKGVPVFLHSVPLLEEGSDGSGQLAAELSRLLYYFANSLSPSHENVEQLFLFAEDEARLPELSEPIKASFGGAVVTVPLDAWLRERADSIQRYAVSIGLALKGA